ncbi:MAG: hypothetical protein JXR46_01170 [Calditrichaceae bacterium]|nr:hypothetical protein [Calditrichaceae bacterium]MBN2707627.1 hypothetical protein [Calditrichaceae bacterium]RQV93203.1 MAG: hypothetical protein EH224_12965 [Calditrichota bacterium]
MNPSTLTSKKIFFFWAPLASTWLMMAIEGPYLAMIIARLAEPKFNLAAYGVAYSIGLLVEAPIIMIMSASTALVKDKDSFIKLKRFIYLLNAIVSVIMIILVIPEVFQMVIVNLIGLPPVVDKLTYHAVICLMPWPAAIGYRRFYQGLLIRAGQTHLVTLGTVIRLIFMSVTAAVLFKLEILPGAYVGVLALSVGVLTEAVASRILAIPTVKSIVHKDAQTNTGLSYGEITRFYYPLALTSMLGLGVQFLQTFFVGQSRMALESLAVLPVVNGLVFLFRSLGLSYQEVVITYLHENQQNYKILRRFGLYLGGVMTIILSVIAFTDISMIWYETVSGLSTKLAEFAVLPTQILILLPALTVLISLQRGTVVYARRTKHITLATLIEVIGILTVLSLTIFFLDWIGVLAAVTAVFFGRTAANLYFQYPVSLIRKQIS